MHQWKLGIGYGQNWAGYATAAIIPIHVSWKGFGVTFTLIFGSFSNSFWNDGKEMKRSGSAFGGSISFGYQYEF